MNEDNRRWGFEEAEDWEYEAGRRTTPPPADQPSDDADACVTALLMRGYAVERKRAVSR